MGYIQDTTFEKEDFSSGIHYAEFDNCTFIECNFENSNLSGIKFNDCSFIECNLSLSKLSNTSFQVIQFQGCKMLELRFDYCNTFGLDLSFEHCQLKHSSFYELKLKNIQFSHCQLEEVDFTNSFLMHANFEMSQLNGAVFDQCNLEHADFRTATHYVVNPEKNKIKKAKFSYPGILGLLTKYDILIEQ